MPPGFSTMADEIVLNLSAVPLPERARRLIDAGRRRAAGIDWFDFVASDYTVVYSVLAALQRGRFCDWGSGLGVVPGLAEMLGYEAIGIEIHDPLVSASRDLLRQFGLRSRIEAGDYYERSDPADLYFAYCWPGKVARTEQRFREVAPDGARLLVYYGPADIRWIAK